MLTQRSLFAYLFIMIAITLFFVITNSSKGDTAWQDTLAKEEKALYALEIDVPLSEEDINMTKALEFYEVRAKYCDAKANKRESLLCYKRTMPWWSKIYRQKEHGL